jgi:ATP-dependent RNA helicase RhlE
MSFDSLGLAEPILRAVHEQGYTTPTPIQAQAIPAVLSGGDLMAGAQTGTGKTAGFTLPMLHRLASTPAVRDARGKLPIRALVLTPTRELAAQVEESVRNYGKYLKLTSMVMFGGVGMQPQIDKLRRGVDIVVATPGRLLDHAQQKTLDLSHVEIFVLDEADRMLDMGFVHDIKKVLALVPQKKQSLLFSATFSDEIKNLADRLLNKPALIEVARRNQTAELIEQKVHPVGREMKKDLLIHLIKSNDWHQVLVFTRMKHGANRLVEHLLKADITAMAIHGNKSQGARTKALADFKSGELRVLVATDIAARGIDIDQLPHVVNYELPNVPEDYVHRIGRTGRAGAQGEAVSLVCVDENGFLRDIEKLIKREIPKEVVPGFAPNPSEKPEPIVLGRMVIGAGAGRGGHRHGGGGRGGDRPAPAGGRGGNGGQGSSRQGNQPARQAASQARPAQPSSQPSGRQGQQAGRPAQPGSRPAQPSGRPAQPAARPQQDGTRRDGHNQGRPPAKAAAPAPRSEPRRDSRPLPRLTQPKRGDS